MSRVILFVARRCGRWAGFWSYGFDRGRLEGRKAANDVYTTNRGR